MDRHGLEEWRGVDLRSRKEKIRRAFALEPVESAEDVPLVINVPCYFGFGNKPRGQDYWKNPAAMVAFEERGCEEHLRLVDDDFVPYFMPWFGTGVIASAFGCPVKEARGNGDDPAVAGPCVHKPQDIARLRIPDPDSSGLMPEVLRFIDYAREHSDLPIALTDMNSPLCTAAQLCGYDNLFVWMYEEPAAVHDLLDLITESLIGWVRIQKEHCGEASDASSGLQGTWSPKGIGIWLSDDDLVSIGPEQYGEFVVDEYSRIFGEFGGGIIHYCGVGSQQTDSILRIRNLRAINNSPLGHFDVFAELRRKTRGRIALEIQDSTPIDPDYYYDKVFGCLDDFRGVLLVNFVQDCLGLTNEGATVPVNWNALDKASTVARSIRRIIERRLNERR